MPTVNILSSILINTNSNKFVCLSVYFCRFQFHFKETCKHQKSFFSFLSWLLNYAEKVFSYRKQSLRSIFELINEIHRHVTIEQFEQSKKEMWKWPYQLMNDQFDVLIKHRIKILYTLQVFIVEVVVVVFFSSFFSNYNVKANFSALFPTKPSKVDGKTKNSNRIGLIVANKRAKMICSNRNTLTYESHTTATEYA